MPEDKKKRDKALAGLLGQKSPQTSTGSQDASKSDKATKGASAITSTSAPDEAVPASPSAPDAPRGVAPLPDEKPSNARSLGSEGEGTPRKSPGESTPDEASGDSASGDLGAWTVGAASGDSTPDPEPDTSASVEASGAWTPGESGEPAADLARGHLVRETTSTLDGKQLRDRALRSTVVASKRPKSVEELGGAPLDDDRFLERARKREDKARQAQSRSEARRMRTEGKQLLKDARRRERAQRLLEAHLEKVSSVGDDLGYDPDRPITRIPDLASEMEQVSFRTIEDERAFIRMAYDGTRNTYLYEVIEPELTPNESGVKDFLEDTLIRTLDGRRAAGTDWKQYLRDAVQQAIVDHDILIDRISTERILYYLIRDFLGYGPIDALMRDDQLEDISCDGPGIPIYVFHRKHESVRTNIVFPDDLDIDSFVIRLAQRSGKHISVADPLLDATLPEGSRLQATLSREVTSRGSSFTIRKFREQPFTPTDLINYGTLTTPMCAYLWFMMEEGRSLMFAGGTASGKTTTLNAICQFIPPEKKIVSIEDTREINLLHENWIAGVTRSGFGGENMAGKRAGTIDMYRLLEAALRQRPEYLLVGEVRGPEALTLFQAMATGHAVYSTMHADTTKSAVYRLENPPINVPRMMLQTLDTVAIQAQVKVKGKMERRIKEVVEIIGFDPDTEDLLTNTVFYWDASKDRHIFTGHSGVFDQIQEKKGWDDEEFQVEWERRMLVLEWMRAQEVTHFHEFSQTIQGYYQRPENVMRRIEADGFRLGADVAKGSRAGDTMSMYEPDEEGEDHGPE